MMAAGAAAMPAAAPRAASPCTHDELDVELELSGASGGGPETLLAFASCLFGYDDAAMSTVVEPLLSDAC